jgi:hypothetical protein
MLLKDISLLFSHLQLTDGGGVPTPSSSLHPIASMHKKEITEIMKLFILILIVNLF